MAHQAQGRQETLQPSPRRVLPMHISISRRFRGILRRRTSITSSAHLCVLLHQPQEPGHHNRRTQAKEQVSWKLGSDDSRGTRSSEVVGSTGRWGIHDYDAQHVRPRHSLRQDAARTGRNLLGALSFDKSQLRYRIQDQRMAVGRIQRCCGNRQGSQWDDRGDIRSLGQEYGVQGQEWEEAGLV